MESVGPSQLAVRVDTADGHRLATVIALGVVVVAAVLAVTGLPSIDLHGPLHRLGIMDPLCGGTRSARLTVLGQWGLAWTYNPLGLVTVIGATALVVRSAVGALTHRWLNVSWHPSARLRRLLISAGVVLLVLLEIRQQSLAWLLTAS
jgi:hypothetical protein